MNKTQLLQKIPYFVEEQAHVQNLADDFEITDLTSNLQAAQKNHLVFYKIYDDAKSQENFQKRLSEAKPGLLILNKHPGNISVPYLIIEECCFLKVQKILLDEFYPLPPNLKLVGITGTNGKTTTVNLAQQISELMGHPAISFGTLGICKNGKIIEDLGGTTPSYIELRRLIHRYGETEHAIFFEVSSHALVQDRLYDLRLDACGWTSFSQDHLDYHKTMQEYFQAKTLIFSHYAKSSAKFFAPSLEKELILKLQENKAPLTVCPSLEDLGYFHTPAFFRADFNKCNLEIALAVNHHLWQAIVKVDLEEIFLPQGRFTTIELGEKLVVIDYAHTPDAIENICKAIRRSFPGRELSVVFGCGGNRDKSKRPLMGAIAESYSDKLYVTSDNPRDEIPEEIIEQICVGLKNNSHFKNSDRTLAIQTALSAAKSHGIILIAGKGHEDYQEIRGIKYPYSDFDVVENFKRKEKMK